MVLDDEERRILSSEKHELSLKVDCELMVLENTIKRISKGTRK